jgi:hypothetical protein
MKEWLLNALQYVRIGLTQVIVFVAGNAWRLVVCNLSNLIRFVYDRIRIGDEYAARRQQAKDAAIGQRSVYQYDGFKLFGIRVKWPTYVRCIAAFADNGFAGNCDCFAHAMRVKIGCGRVRVFIVGLDIRKVHYLFEFRDGRGLHTYDLTPTGCHYAAKSARAVMEERHPDKIVYTVW